MLLKKVFDGAFFATHFIFEDFDFSLELNVFLFVGVRRLFQLENFFLELLGQFSVW